MDGWRLACLAAALAAEPVAAGVLYKCSAANGQVSIQSDPCPAGSALVWKRDASPEAAPTPEQQAATAERREREARNARELSLAAGTTRRPEPERPRPARPEPEPDEAQAPAARGPCRRAHELAGQIRALEWLELDQGQQARLERWVVDQCEQARIGD